MKLLKRVAKFARDYWLILLILTAIVGGIFFFASPPAFVSGISMFFAFYPYSSAALGAFMLEQSLTIISSIAALVFVGAVACIKALGDFVGWGVGLLKRRFFPHTIPQVQPDEIGLPAKEEPRQNKVTSFLKNHWLPILIAGAIVVGVVCFFWPPTFLLLFAQTIAAYLEISVLIAVKAAISGVVAASVTGAGASIIGVGGFIKKLGDGIVKFAGCIKGRFSSKEKDGEPKINEDSKHDSSAATLGLLGGRSLSDEEVHSKSDAHHPSPLEAAFAPTDPKITEVAAAAL